MLKEFNRDVLSRRSVAFLLTALAVLMTFGIITTDSLPVWQAAVVAVVDVTLIMVTLYSWSHHSPFLRGLLYSNPRPTQPPPAPDLLADLLAAAPVTRVSTGTTALEIPALIAVDQVRPAQSDANTVDIVDIVDDAAATDPHLQQDGHHVDADGVDDS